MGGDDNGRTLIWKHVCISFDHQQVHTQSEDAIEAVQ
jgi:hypothetical protein